MSLPGINQICLSNNGARWNEEQPPFLDISKKRLIQKAVCLTSQKILNERDATRNMGSTVENTDFFEQKRSGLAQKGTKTMVLLSGRSWVRIPPGTLTHQAGTERIGSRFFNQKTEWG